MRKLIVLIMTSVLATGAVANADQVTVVENAADFIRIGDITENNGDPLSPGITPSKTDDAAIYHRLDVDVSDPNDELVQVAVCLYDSAVITTPDNTNCGDGATDISTLNAGDDFPTHSAGLWEGETILESALQMSFIPVLYDPALPDDGTNGKSIGDFYPTGNDYHIVSREEVSGSNASRVTKVDDLGSNIEDEAGDVWALEFAFGLLAAAHHADTWKIRVLATYVDTEGNETKLELKGEDSYEVEYFQAFEDTGRDQVVNYGEVAHDTDVTEEDIPTGDYYVNYDSYVVLTADLFEKTASPNNVLGFSGDTNPGDDEVSLECGKTGEAKTLFDEIAFDAADGSDESSKALLSLAPNSQPVGDADPSQPLTADTHDCTFYAGTNIDTGEYSNSITIAILEGAMP